jgi:hypothetical protein
VGSRQVSASKALVIEVEGVADSDRTPYSPFLPTPRAGEAYTAVERQRGASET